MFPQLTKAGHICIVELKSIVMKTLKTLGLLLLMATGVLAQPDPNDLFISGYVLDASGQAQANHEVCVSYVSNNPSLPSDTICTTTNANGYYFITVTNGSLTGPNVSFDVYTYDPCALLPIVQTVNNGQGSIDVVDVDFSICAVNSTCSASFTSSNDSINGTWTFVASATGTAPFTYDWWVDGTSYTTQTVSHMFNGGTVGVYLTITDANGCTSMEGDTLYLDGNLNCGVTIDAQSSPILGGETLTANAVGTAPFQYSWNTGQNTQAIDVVQAGTYCVIITDNSGCSSASCYTYNGPNQGCTATIQATTDTFGVTTFVASSNGTAPFTYSWSTGHTTQSIMAELPGAYCVEVTDASGCVATACDSVAVNPGNCDASFTNSGPTPIGYTFSANVQSNSLYYYWEIDGVPSGTGYDAYAPGFSNGVHTICLTVIDSLNMCSDTQCQTITVGNNNCAGYISGQVYAGSPNYSLDEGVVYLITYDQNTNQLTAVDSMVLDSGYWYSFGPLDCGDYLIKAAAYPGSQYYSNHIPTYYGNSPFWGFAQTVSLSQVNTQVTADVTLIASNNPGGPGFIGGDVTQGANKADLGDPISGMQVMLFNLSGGAVAYTYTDGNGEFGFDNLAYGTYQVYVEQLGVQTIPAVVTIGEDEPSVNDVHILASETLISTGIEEFDFEGAISDVYPNPVLNQAAVTFKLEAEVMVDVNILDLAGRTVSTQTVSIAGGESTLRISAEGLNGGYYFLNIQDVDGAFSVTRKFMRVD